MHIFYEYIWKSVYLVWCILCSGLFFYCIYHVCINITISTNML